MNRQPRVRHWETLDVGEVDDRGVFGFQEIVRRSPRTGREARYQILHSRPWINVIALTPDELLVLVEQYRHGVDAVTLEIPGGMVEPGEAPAAAAARELREETGYTGNAPELLGSMHPNPAIQNNVCTTWLVGQARRTVEPSPDEGEDIAVVTAPLGEIPEMIRAGLITHSLVLAAFHWLELRKASSPLR